MAISELLRVEPGAVDLSAYDADAQPGFDGRKKDGKVALEQLAPTLADLQGKLFAAGYTGGSQRILLVVQGMDTAGKGGLLKHCVGVFDPGGVHIRSFKQPTEEELSHDFLWRVQKETPEAGKIGIFDRSHYEDVLIVKVHELVGAAEIERRYDAINEFESRLADEGTTLIKCMLHISKDEQRRRLLARLEDPAKQWKYKPQDVDERERWHDYQSAYETALDRCSTDVAPWHVVPSNKKWYRSWAVSMLLLEALTNMRLEWPKVDYEVEAEKKRVANA